MSDSHNILVSRITALQARIQKLAAARKIAPGQVRLIAVSKTRSVEEIEGARQAGLWRFGENRVQELTDKAPRLNANIEWHMIGHLQRNKVRSAVRLAAWIHSVDSLELLRRIDRIAGEEGRRPRILLQVNLAGEESKAGIEPRDCLKLAAAARDCQNIECQGLMTMAPYEAGQRELQSIFGGLRELRDRLRKELEMPLPELSMGMSNDYETAIQEGATMVRIGGAVFEFSL